MTRFFATSSSDSVADIESSPGIQTANMSGSIDREEVALRTYHKRCIENENFRAFDDGDFVAVVGTLILDGKIGGEVLELVYEHVTSGNQSVIREQGLGHYAVVVCEDDELTAFTDPNGVFELYYMSGENWIISDGLAACSRSLDSRTVNRHQLFELAIEYSEISEASVFDSVDRLFGSEMLEVNLTDGTLRVSEVGLPERDWDYTDASFGDVLTDYASRVRDTFEELEQASDSIGVQATGGLDSRTVLGGLLNEGVEPIILYGVGNSKLTNTKDSDAMLAKRFADRYDLPFEQLDWREEYPLGIDTWNNLFRSYGFDFLMYGATTSFFDSFTDRGENMPELVMSGYGFGTVSNTYFWEMSDVTPISFEDLVKDYFTAVDCFENSLRNRSEYEEELVDECQAALQKLTNEPLEEPFDIGEFSKVIQLLFGRPQSAYASSANEFTFHIAPLATYELSRPVIDFPTEYRAGERIRIHLIKDLFPDILEPPLFSGRKQASITENGRIRRPVSERLKQRVDDSFPEFLLQLIRPVYYRFTDNNPLDDIDTEILEEAADYIETTGVIDNQFEAEKQHGSVRQTLRLALLCYAVDQIGYDSLQR
ncbi:hypothetical protein [Halobacterium rubrum]|uniref:hypothetical protein n=1 Tax=Halobacterium TaxID=2239 RepID=UPI001F38B9F6|nr:MULTISPECIES: hypothetical protein [Halobacterium]MDH5021360.1 hypothetical protein [Halobacterium rubrum]